MHSPRSNSLPSAPARSRALPVVGARGAPFAAIARACGLGIGLTWVVALLMLMLGHQSALLAGLLFSLSCAAACRGVLLGRPGLGALSGGVVGLACSAVSFLRYPGPAVAVWSWLLLVALGALAGALGTLKRPQSNA